MNKAELAVAQFLLDAYEKAQQHADTLDPKRTNKGKHADTVRNLMAISHRASDAFTSLCKRVPFEVSLHELNTESPAEWTKNPQWKVPALQPAARSR